MTDSYDNWVKRVVADRTAKPLKDGEFVQAPAAEPFGAVEFLIIQKKYFKTEIGKKGDYYIYHFYPDPHHFGVHGTLGPSGPSAFYEKMAGALLEMFKREEQIEAVWTDEMQAYAVRVSGWTKHVWGDELAIRVIDLLDEILGSN